MAKPDATPRKLGDGGGLHLLVQPHGAKLWRWTYRWRGRQNTLSLGAYPAVSLAAAREKRDALRKQLAAGENPSEARKAAERNARLLEATSFESVAREWLDDQKEILAPVTHEKAVWMLETFVFPQIGRRPISLVTAPELLDLLRKVEKGGRRETASRVRARCGQVFRYAVATGRAVGDPTVSLRGALLPPHRQHYATITEPSKIGALIRAIRGHDGHYVTGCALRLAPLVFVRPGELRQAQWRELDLDRREWRIPAGRMKMKVEHVVPLSRQSVQILTELRPLTGNGPHVFPSVRTPSRSLSDGTLNSALRRLGYSKEEMTAHGFRAMASTQLNEMGYPVDVIERQLAHSERNKVRAAYNRASYMRERVAMMQDWADHLDRLASNLRIVDSTHGQ